MMVSSMVPLIATIAKKVGVSATLLLSICTVETNLKNVNNFNDGNGGSFGVCQLNLNTARGINPAVDRLALQIPEVNIEIAAIYLKQLYDKYNNPWHSAAAYNAGLALIDNGSYRNQVYVSKVKLVYTKYMKGKKQ